MVLFGMEALPNGCHGLGMDALACGWASSMDVIMVWAWMHWPMDGLVAWTISWFGPRLGMDGARI